MQLHDTISNGMNPLIAPLEPCTNNVDNPLMHLDGNHNPSKSQFKSQPILNITHSKHFILHHKISKLNIQKHNQTYLSRNHLTFLIKI